MKTQRYLCFILCVAIGLTTACTTDESTTTLSSDATLSMFYLSHDSLPTLKKITFTIDNDSNVIYNIDSLPYLTPLHELTPTIYGNTLKQIVINDTTTYTGTDTIDFTKPVTITTLATDGESTRTYIVRVCTHQIDPDLYNWQGINSEIVADQTIVQQKTVMYNNRLCYFVKNTTEITLFTSTDGKQWTRQTINGLPATTNLDGIVATDSCLLVIDGNTLYQATTPTTWNARATDLPVSRLAFAMNNQLFAIGQTSDTRYMFASPDLLMWNNLGSLPSNFPDSDFAVCVDTEPSGKYRAFVVGGRKTDGSILGTVWSSADGSYWANLAASKEWFAPRYGAAVVQYADELLLIGGADNNGPCADKQWYSPDFGLTWDTMPAKNMLPDLWLARYGHSIIVDSDSYIYIVGGQTATTVLSDVWKGRKNSEAPGFVN
ncbi:MAG: DUF6242 domain-containing protein [Paludibacteraceae bacterium]